MTVEAILGYLAMKGIDPSEFYGWICTADAEALAWMNEDQKREQDAARRRSASSSTSPPMLGRK